MTTKRKTAATPSVAFARALRDLGLRQGRDFNIRGEYNRAGERLRTWTMTHGDHAKLVLDNADRIVAAVAADGNWHVRVESILDGRIARITNG